LRGADSLFSDARGLAQRCPDALAAELTALWSAPVISPDRATVLRSASVMVRDERLVSALEAVVRDPARSIETRAGALSTLSSYLDAGRWVEFTFLKDPPDSASLRMFVGSMPDPVHGEGTRPIPAGFPLQFRQLLESLRDSDSSSAIRSAARRFIVFLEYSKKQQEPQPKQPPAAPSPPGS
jgi:hypothetical protein